MLDKLRVLYDCLEVPQEERSNLCIKEAFSLEELCKVDKVAAIREEVAKWQAVKKENMAKILGRAKAELEGIWRYRMVGARTQEEGEYVAQPQGGVVDKSSKGGRYLVERSKAFGSNR